MPNWRLAASSSQRSSERKAGLARPSKAWMSAHSRRTISRASTRLFRIEDGLLRNQVSKRAPKFLSVKEREGHSARYALHLLSKRCPPRIDRKPGKSSAILARTRNQYCRL